MVLARVEQSPTETDFVENPYPFYDRIRALGDFVFWKDYDMPMATTHEAVMAVLRHRSLGRRIPDEQRKPVRPELRAFYDVEAHSMLELEPPDHTRLRALVLRAFTKTRVQSLAPEISQIADGLIAGFPEGPFDLIERFAGPLPVLMIARLLGIPPEHVTQLQNWSNRMVAMYQARRSPKIEEDAARAAAEFSTFLREFIEARRPKPQNDLISELIAAEMEGTRLSTDELVSTCILLLNAGHEATVHTLGNAVVHLMNFDGRADALAPEAIESTVEECLRFDPPLHMFTRHVYENVEICGETFEAGQEIGCLLASATHDDAVWPDARVFDPFRPIRANAAFGAGIHFCVGAPLARLELQLALPLLFAQCPRLKFVEDPKVANLYHFRGRERIMVENDPA